MQTKSLVNPAFRAVPLPPDNPPPPLKKQKRWPTAYERRGTERWKTFRHIVQQDCLVEEM